MKKVLILSPYLPWPLRSGGNVGVYYMLSYICRYVDVTFMYIYNKKNNNEASLKAIQEKLPNVKFGCYYYRNSSNKKYEFARKLEKRIDESVKFGEFSKMNLNVLDQLTPGFANFANEYIDREKIDIVQIEFVSFLPMVYMLPEHVIKIFIHHELGYVRDQLTYGDDMYSNVIKAFRKDCEFSMLNRFDIVAALTEVDAKKLEEEGCKSKLAVSTLAISDKTQPYVAQKFDGRLTFVGGSGHFPNFDGLQWFCKEVLPLVRQEIPSIKMEIIGSWSEEHRKVIQNIDSSLTFLGFVDKLQDGIRNSVMVVPINIGSGMRMKIVEAANYSVPFVSTVVGAEGLDFTSGTDCFISHVAEAMAQDIVRLCKDATLYESLSKNVHKTFVDKFSYEALGKKRLALYE